jgi:hypothetical protein
MFSKATNIPSTYPQYIREEGGNPKLNFSYLSGSNIDPEAPDEVLRIVSEKDFPKVRTFLESVARNSMNSKATYETGLKHFQPFPVN